MDVQGCIYVVPNIWEQLCVAAPPELQLVSFKVPSVNAVNSLFNLQMREDPPPGRLVGADSGHSDNKVLSSDGEDEDEDEMYDSFDCQTDLPTILEDLISQGVQHFDKIDVASGSNCIVDEVSDNDGAVNNREIPVIQSLQDLYVFGRLPHSITSCNMRIFSNVSQGLRSDEKYRYEDRRRFIERLMLLSIFDLTEISDSLTSLVQQKQDNLKNNRNRN